MEAVVRHKGQQYRVKEGDVLLVDLLDLAKGANFDFEDVLLRGTDIGTPTVKGAKVTATVVEPLWKDKKVITLKYRRRKANSRRIRGHRQKYSLVKVTKIS
ncbi:MAG: 50S ribosomal protein L21 [Planctomycetota bacterium]